MGASRTIGRALGVTAIVGAAAVAAAFGAHRVLPAEGRAARGVTVAGVALGDEDPRAAIEESAKKLLDRRFSFNYGGELLVEASLTELGATIDVDEALARAMSVGREDEIVARIDDALEARRGHVDVPLPVTVPAAGLAMRLERLKEERDAPPTNAKLLIDTGEATSHTPGKYIDVYAAVAAIDRALASGGAAAIELPAYEILPRASRDVVAHIDATQVLSRFETVFGYLGGQANRAQNIRRAASEMDGVVLMPGEIVSFNQNVGPRSIENGFATAPEIFKGEMREGVGGGTCQVAGTLHAAAFFGGITIAERANHSRPSGYIRLGLDATVVYPTTDLKLQNPFSFPIVIHSTIDKGTLAFELRGRERPATVDLSTETVGVADFKRKIEEVSYLAEGSAKLKQKGRRGVSVRKTRVIHLRDGKERVEVTTDTYPATFEIWMIGPHTDPDKALPPFEGPADTQKPSGVG